MKEIGIFGILLLFALTNIVSANDNYITYTQTFPWLGSDGEDPEVVFADLIEQERLVAVYSRDIHILWFDSCDDWHNSGMKIRNDQEYIIKIFRDIPNNNKYHTIRIPPRDPTTIIVDINGTGNYTSIQEGIDNSVNGDTILVYPGTYYENINYNGKNITVASLYITTQERSYIDSTVIDGNQNGSVVTFESGEDTTAIVCGFTIQNGSGTHNFGNIRGGGIFCKDASLIIMSCLIEYNNAEIGAGIHCRYSDIILENTMICHNHAFLVGGGLYLRDNSTATFSSDNRCNIYLNYAGRGSDVLPIRLKN